MLHKEIPFLRIGLPFCCGIISGLYYQPDKTSLVLSSLIIITCFAVSLFYNRYQVNFLFGSSLTAALFLCGLMLYQNEKNSLSDLDQHENVFTAALSDIPVEKASSMMLKVRLERENTAAGSVPVKGSILLYVKKDSSLFSFLPGDELVISCTPIEITNRGNPYEFDYKFFMENNGTKYYAYISESGILRHKVPSYRKLEYRALIIREKIIDMFRNRGITGDELALVAAITLGQKNMLEPEQKQNFIRAGVMHIMAVSGLHAVILSLFLYNALFFLKGRLNIIRILITILALWLFAFVTGLTPSVLRATLMFSFIQAGSLMKRPVNAINTVLASAFILILIRPSVIFDAGFLLSYSAVLYIICFYNDFYLKMHFKNWLADKIWQSAALTIIAQLGTLPLTIMLFNRFPVYFILTNIIIVPLSSLLIITGCLIPVLYPVRFLSGGLALFLSKATVLTEFLTEKASALPYSNIENIGMTTYVCILLEATIFLFLFYLLKKKTISFLWPLSFLLVVTAVNRATDIYVRRTNELIVYNTPGTLSVGIRSGKMLNIYSDTASVQPAVSRHCAALGLNLKINVVREQGCYLRAGGHTILVSNTGDLNLLDYRKTDIAIIKELNRTSPKDILFNRPPGSVTILSGGYSGFERANRTGAFFRDSVHYIKRYGAYKTRI